MRRSLLSLLATVLTVALAAPVLAQSAPQPERLPPPPAIVFPVAGPITFHDSYFDSRGDEQHLAQDLMGEKLLPVVAAHDGVIRWISNLEQEPGGHYAMTIRHSSGWSTVYVHLNNDNPGTDDGLGGLRWAYAPGLRSGSRVIAGQFIGYLGDSGNAETTAPHLHFELLRPDGTPENPYEELLEAPRLLITPEQMVTGVSTALGSEAPATHWEFAEGYTAESFDTYILIGNPGVSPVEARISLMLPTGSVVPARLDVPARSRATLRVDDLVPADSVAATVDATGPVVAERAMYFRNRGAVDGHVAEAVATPGPHWYLAEGYTGPGFETWLLVENPSTHEVPTRVRFLPGHGPAVDVERTLPPTSRTTFRVSDWVANDDVSQVVDALDGSGLVAERAVYVNEEGGRNGGTVANGIPELSRTWYFAEGTASPTTQSWLLLANPTTNTVEARVTVLGRSGRAGDTVVSLPPDSRRTIEVRSVAPSYSGDLGLEVTATTPIAAERSMYFPQGASDAQGAPSARNEWYFAEGYIGGAFGTTFALVNPTRTSASVTLRLDAPGGTITRYVHVQVPARSRRTVDARTVELAHPEFSTVVTSTIPVVVERSMTFGYVAPA